jgi:hypothetical protein
MIETIPNGPFPQPLAMAPQADETIGPFQP